MATTSENLKAFIQGGAAIAREVGTRVHANKVPLKPDGTYVALPFIYFAVVDQERADCLGDGTGTPPLKVIYQAQAVAQSDGHAERIGALLQDRLHLYTGTFGAATVSRIWCEGPLVDYTDRAGAGDRGFHTCAYSVEVAL